MPLVLHQCYGEMRMSKWLKVGKKTTDKIKGKNYLNHIKNTSALSISNHGATKCWRIRFINQSRILPFFYVSYPFSYVTIVMIQLSVPKSHSILVSAESVIDTE